MRPGGVALIQDLRPEATEEAIVETVRGLNLGSVNAVLQTVRGERPQNTVPLPEVAEQHAQRYSALVAAGLAPTRQSVV